MLFKSIIPVILITTVVQTNGYAILSRSKRATDEEFSTAVNKMQMISRVVNGISLQQGLFKGTIPSDELISELLNLGDVKPSDIDQIDMATLKAVVDKMKALPSKIIRDQGVIKMESRLKALNSVVEKSNGVKKLEEPNKEFMAEIQKLKALKTNWNKLNTYADRIDTLFHYNAKIQKGTTMIHKDMVTLLDKLQPVFKGLKKNRLDSYKSSLSDKLMGFEKTFASFVDILASVAVYNDNAAIINYVDKTDTPLMNSVKNNIDEVNGVLHEVTASVSSFHILGQLFVRSHHRSGNRDVSYAPAFANELTDLALIPNDLKDGWVKKAVDGQDDFLSEALKKLQSLLSPLSELEKTSGDNSKEVITTMSTISNRILGFSAIGFPLDSFGAKLKDIQTAANDNNVIPPNHPNFKTLLDSIDLLFNHLKAIDALIEVSKVLGTDETAAKLQKLIDLVEYTDDDDLSLKIGKLSKSKDFQFILQSAKKCEKLLPLIRSDPQRTVQTLATSVGSQYKEMKTFVTGSSKFLTMLTTLGGINELKSFGKVIETVDNLSDKNLKPLGDFDAVITSVDLVKTKLKEVEGLIGKMKGATSLEVGKLMKLDDFAANAKTFGTATRGITSMKSFMDNSKNYAMVKQASATVIAEKNAAGALNKQDSKNLKDLAQLDQNLNNLHKSLTGYVGSVSSVDSDNLADYLDIFEKAKSVQGLDVNFLSARTSVEKLLTGVKDQARKIEMQNFLPVLKSLNEIGLDFAKHQTSFGAARTSLDWLDMAFAKLDVLNTVTTLSPVASTRLAETSLKPLRVTPSQMPSPRGAGAIQRARARKPATEEQKSSEMSTGTMVLIVVAAVAIYSFFFFDFLCYCHDPKYEYIFSNIKTCCGLRKKKKENGGNGGNTGQGGQGGMENGGASTAVATPSGTPSNNNPRNEAPPPPAPAAPPPQPQEPPRNQNPPPNRLDFGSTVLLGIALRVINGLSQLVIRDIFPRLQSIADHLLERPQGVHRTHERIVISTRAEAPGRPMHANKFEQPGSFFIVSAGPCARVDNTPGGDEYPIVNFYHMWDHNGIEDVVALGNNIGDRFFDDYFPMEIGTRMFGNTRVDCIQRESMFNNFVEFRQLQVTIGGRVRNVNHYWFESFHNEFHLHPSDAQIEALLALLKTLRDRRVVYHCADGLKGSAIAGFVQFAHKQMEDGSYTSFLDCLNAFRRIRHNALHHLTEVAICAVLIGDMIHEQYNQEPEIIRQWNAVRRGLRSL